MKRVLVIQLARFGDLVQSKRLLLSCAGDTGAEVHLAVDASLAALARVLYPFARVHALPAHARGSGVSEGPGGESEIFSLARAAFEKLKKLRFDEVYNLNISSLSMTLAGMFPFEATRGYAVFQGQPLRSKWCRMAARWTSSRADSPMNLVDFWGCFHAFPVAPDAVNPVAAPAGTGKVGVALSGRESRRSLPVSVLAGVVRTVFEARNGPELVCLGSAQERSLVRRLARELGPQAERRIIDLAGKTALEDLPEVVGELDLLLTPDTGLMHLAAHLGVPVQAFFLSSAWAWETGPYGLGHTVWQSVKACSPCLESRPCPRDVACLSAFSERAFLDRLAREVSLKKGGTQRGRAETQDVFQNVPKDNSHGAQAALSSPSFSVDETGILKLVTDFDAVGGTFRVQPRDPYDDDRKAKRRTLGEYLGVGEGTGMPGQTDQKEIPRGPGAPGLFQEADWMLPDPLPAGSVFNGPGGLGGDFSDGCPGGYSGGCPGGHSGNRPDGSSGDSSSHLSGHLPGHLPGASHSSGKDRAKALCSGPDVPGVSGASHSPSTPDTGPL